MLSKALDISSATAWVAPDLLKLVSAIFDQIFTSHQMIAL